MAAIFVACNIALPQLFHLIPQGGIIFAPLSLVILVGAYKFGWRVGLLAALASPVVNHLLFGQPAADVMTLMAIKLALLAVIAEQHITGNVFPCCSLLLSCWRVSCWVDLPNWHSLVALPPPLPTSLSAGRACCCKYSGHTPYLDCGSHNKWNEIYWLKATINET